MSEAGLPPCGIAALALAKRGYHPVAVGPGGKVPIAKYREYRGGKCVGFSESLRTTAGVKEVWTAHPDANVAICLPGLVQVDLDSVEAVEAVEALDLPPVPTVRTPRAKHGMGGRRLIFRDSDELTKLSGKGSVLGIEWSRGSNMVGLVAPSVFVNPSRGGEYIEEVSFMEVDPVPLSDCPELVGLLRSSSEGDRAEEASNGRRKGSALIPKEISTGSRNNTLAQQAALFRAAGMDEDEILHALRGINACGRMERPLPDEEVAGIVKSAMRVPPKPWSGPAVEDFIRERFTTFGFDRGKEVKYAQLVFRVLLNRCDAEGVCDPGPGIRGLGKAIGGRYAADKGIKALERSGLLTREIRGQAATRYMLNLWGHPQRRFEGT